MGLGDNPRYVGKPRSVQEAAFRGWTNGSNMSTGVGHPNDKGRLIDTIDRLAESGYDVDPDVVEEWLIQWGFSAQNVGEIMKVVRGVVDGKVKRDPQAGRYWNDKAVDYWETEVGD